MTMTTMIHSSMLAKGWRGWSHRKGGRNRLACLEMRRQQGVWLQVFGLLLAVDSSWILFGSVWFLGWLWRDWLVDWPLGWDSLEKISAGLRIPLTLGRSKQPGRGPKLTFRVSWLWLFGSPFPSSSNTQHGRSLGRDSPAASCHMGLVNIVETHDAQRDGTWEMLSVLQFFFPQKIYRKTWKTWEQTSHFDSEVWSWHLINSDMPRQIAGCRLQKNWLAAYDDEAASTTDVFKRWKKGC